MRITDTKTYVMDRPDTAAKATVKPAETSATVVDGRTQVAADAASRADVAHAERLKAIAAAIESGAYQVDFDTLAERIVADEIARRGLT